MTEPQPIGRLSCSLGIEGMFVDRQEIGPPGEFERLSRMTDEELD